eukprot:4082514-Pyramimonas_sp.AAC.1
MEKASPHRAASRLITVGGSWRGSPTSSSASIPLVRGTKLEGSVHWEDSSEIIGGDRGGGIYPA